MKVHTYVDQFAMQQKIIKIFDDTYLFLLVKLQYVRQAYVYVIPVPFYRVVYRVPVGPEIASTNCTLCVDYFLAPDN